MVEVQEISVTIDPNGQVQLEVHGVKGESCLDITRALEAALGNVILVREMTPEALESPSNEEAVSPNLKTRQ